MAEECIEFRKIENRCQELKEWIRHTAPHCLSEQRHLLEGSEERSYWAHGYLCALQDVVLLFSKESLSDQDYEASQKYAA
jgi:hypothetical protein